MTDRDDDAETTEGQRANAMKVLARLGIKS